MYIRFILCAVLLVNINFSLANNDQDEDSSEYGVAEGDIGTNCTCGFVNKENERIVDGKELKTIEWPMMAELVIKNDHFCAGTVITKRHIVTVAHCGLHPITLKKLDYNRFKIYVGIDNINGDRAGGQVFGIQQFIAHPDYDPKINLNDIAVIYLNGDIDFSTKNVGPACLPVGNENIQDAYVKVIAWRKSKRRGGTEPIIDVNAQVMARRYCETLHRHYFHEGSQICTYTEKKVLCVGHSGGPILWRDPDTNRYVLVAASDGDRNCKGLAINTNVTWFVPWIQRTIEATDSSVRTCSKITS